MAKRRILIGVCLVGLASLILIASSTREDLMAFEGLPALLNADVGQEVADLQDDTPQLLEDTDVADDDSGGLRAGRSRYLLNTRLDSKLVNRFDEAVDFLDASPTVSGWLSGDNWINVSVSDAESYLIASAGHRRLGEFLPSWGMTFTGGSPLVTGPSDDDFAVDDLEDGNVTAELSEASGLILLLIGLLGLWFARRRVNRLPAA